MNEKWASLIYKSQYRQPENKTSTAFFTSRKLISAQYSNRSNGGSSRRGPKMNNKSINPNFSFYNQNTPSYAWKYGEDNNSIKGFLVK